MTVKIGEKIKELRKKADITQEKFAEYLGVTAQAVSKWEVEGCYPDIEMLPSIANFFNVTIDELMCFDISKNQEKINEIFKQIHIHWLKGTAVEFLRNAVQEFPNNYELLYCLADFLKIESNNDEETLKNVHESVSICKRILEDCINDNLRFRSLKSLAYSYNQIGDKEKALETANKLPSRYNSRENVLADIIGENKEIGVVISAKNDSIISIEGLELFADEKNIQPIIESLEFLINTSGYINVDFGDIVKMVKNNNAYFANCIQVKGIPEDIDRSHKNCVKGVILDIKSGPTGDRNSIGKFIDNIEKSFGGENVSVVYGIRFDDTMNGNEVAASVIELSSCD